ncbi:MAG: hypothetical protein U9Q22_07265 [Candidatus Altiarchaeota archaeon]|nr:hypothetical protein [Candidatus Altiarchaeota archaeon]
MASKKPNPKKGKKPVKKRNVKAKISDEELRKLQKDLRKSMGKSILIEEDILKLKSKLRLHEPAKIKPKKKPSVFYRKFVFECGKCVGEFKHTVRIPMIKHKVICPKCSEEHILQIKPIAGDYEVKLPKSMKLVK